jgi:hypothetical protein
MRCSCVRPRLVPSNSCQSVVFFSFFFFWHASTASCCHAWVQVLLSRTRRDATIAGTSEAHMHPTCASGPDATRAQLPPLTCARSSGPLTYYDERCLCRPESVSADGVAREEAACNRRPCYQAHYRPWRSVKQMSAPSCLRWASANVVSSFPTCG